MKIVKESINFKKEVNPTAAMGIGLFKKWENLGIHFWLGWQDGPQEKQKILDDPEPMRYFIDKLIELGVDPKDMSISRANSIDIAPYQVLNGNRVLHQCLTEEDANMLLKTLKKFEPELNNWSITKGNNLSGLYIKIYERDLPNWLESLEDNRKLYRAL